VDDEERMEEAGEAGEWHSVLLIKRSQFSSFA